MDHDQEMVPSANTCWTNGRLGITGKRGDGHLSNHPPRSSSSPTLQYLDILEHSMACMVVGDFGGSEASIHFLPITIATLA